MILLLIGASTMSGLSFVLLFQFSACSRTVSGPDGDTCRQTVDHTWREVRYNTSAE